MPNSSHWIDISAGLAIGTHRADSLPLEVIEPCHVDPSIVGDSSELAALAITKVVRAANDGKLPLFAATLGMPPWEFITLLDEQSRRLVRFAPFQVDLWAELLPELFTPLVELLRDYRSGDDPLNWCVSHALASACFGRRHLWQDLGLRGREDVSRLLSQHFSGLFVRNTQDLKWKRFLFKELGERLGHPDLLPPGCNGCDQMHICFPDKKDS